jgi:Protein of unknown function (DUF3293)
VDNRLRQAYSSAHYYFETPDGELLLQVDRPSPALHLLLLAKGTASAVALTAWNPGSTLQDDAANRRAQQDLERELSALQLTCIPGRHEDPAGHWPNECSTLVLGLTHFDAQRLAARFGQLAFLWSDATGTPRLIETRLNPEAT